MKLSETTTRNAADPASVKHAPVSERELGKALCGAKTGSRTRTSAAVDRPACHRIWNQPERSA